MRTGWVLVAIVFLALAPAVTADPPVTRLAERTLSNPADDGQAVSRTNLDLRTDPGAVRIADPSMEGPLQVVDMPNSPSAVSDNTLLARPADPNFGGGSTLDVGFYGANVWTRSIVQFPLSSLPSNATVRSATLSLYLEAAAKNDAMTIGVYRITSPWTEFGSSWELEDSVTQWNSTVNGTGGGDFDPAALDAVSGVTDVLGWYAWNVTTTVEGWWSGIVPNHGLLLRQVDDEARDVLGQKMFSSSDSTNASARPRLTITFTTPMAVGGAFGLPIWVPVLPVIAVAAWLVARRAFRVSFRPTEAFLILEDGRLVAHAALAEGALRDELATSGMLTLVARFVKDSFTPGSGRPGELRSLQVDDRHVSIAKDASLYLAVVSTGEAPRNLPESMMAFLAAVREMHGSTLTAWDGFRESVADIETRLRKFLDGLPRTGRRAPNSLA